MGHAQVRIAPEGDAIAVSPDGARWNVAYVTPGAPPLFCRHLVVQATAADVFERAPSARALAKDVLLEGSEQAPLKLHAAAPSGRLPWPTLVADGRSEQEAVAGYVAAHPEDAELQAANVQWLLHRDPLSAPSATSPSMRAALRAAKDSEAIRTELTRAITTADGAHLTPARLAGLILLDLHDTQLTGELGALLERVAQARTGSKAQGASGPSELGWIIWEVGASLHGAPPPAALTQTLQTVLSDDFTLSDDTARIAAIRALASSTDGPVVGRLQALAKTSAGPLPEWPNRYQDAAKELGDPSAPVGAWARVALKRFGRPLSP
jgi:hypothetical protein